MDKPVTPSEELSSPKESIPEKVTQHWDTLRLWMTQTWRIGMLLSKGGYLTSERKRLFTKLGEDVYYRMQKGEFSNPDLEPIVKNIDKLTRKLELEELQIRAVRFGHSRQKDSTELDGIDHA